jgi:hypothetical protein
LGKLRRWTLGEIENFESWKVEKWMKLRGLEMLENG